MSWRVDESEQVLEVRRRVDVLAVTSAAALKCSANTYTRRITNARNSAQRPEEHRAEWAGGGGEERGDALELLARAVRALDAHDDVAVFFEAGVQLLERRADLALLPASSR